MRCEHVAFTKTYFLSTSCSRSGNYIADVADVVPCIAPRGQIGRSPRFCIRPGKPMKFLWNIVPWPRLGMARPLGRRWAATAVVLRWWNQLLAAAAPALALWILGWWPKCGFAVGPTAKNRHFWKTYLIYLFSSYFSFFCSYLVPSYVCLTKLCVEKCDLLRLRAIAVRMCSRSTHLHLKSFLADSQTFGCSMSGGYPFLLLGCSVPLICLPAGCPA